VFGSPRAQRWAGRRPDRREQHRLGGGIALGWGVKAIGSLAGLGALLLGFMLIPYKEGFVGGEAHFDDRNDGVPW